MFLSRALPLVALLGMSACGASSDASQASGDAGALPSGDAARPSAQEQEAGADGGTIPIDAGRPRADAPSIPCTDAVTDVYVTPVLPPMSALRRGDVVRCAPDTALSQADVQTTVAGKGIPTKATSGTTMYRIAFRTERGDGSAGVSSARVYLPDTPKSLPLPVVVVAHPTTGISASCTPSKDESSLRDLALPWAGLGYAVIAPDYAGLGSEGVQGYQDNRDTAQSTLDGARALRKMLSPGTLTSKVLLVGYSQGGGAALSAQALEKTYGCDGKLAGVITFAPQWASRLNSFGYVSMLRTPDALTVASGLMKSEVAVLRAYAYFANYVGLAHAADGFPAAGRTSLAGGVTSLCDTPLGGFIQGTAFFVRDLVDDTLRTSLLACIDSSGTTCAEPGKSYYAFLKRNILTADLTGAPVLIVQGLADQIMVPAEEAACNIAKLQADGVTPQVCTDAPAVHTSVVSRNMDFAIKWGTAKLEGTEVPSCSADGMPECTP
jgi:pimeloyl-ACP methyl ester carboxylesterase